MRLRTSLSAWSVGLFTALGLEVSACGSTAEDGPGPLPCTNPMPAVAGYDSGYQSCDGYWMHRTSVVECQSPVPRPDYTCLVVSVPGGCTTDADCMAEPNSYCTSQVGGDGSCHCATGCRRDSDCSAGEICVCNEVMGACHPASCTSNADCGIGKLCASYDAMPHCGDITYACQTDDDQCASNSDCKQGMACTIVGGRRVCTEAGCVIGRPFLVAGEERLSEPVRRADWCSQVRPECAALSPELRAELARHWTRVGLMEHASIAAFARFLLQLLALGAPPHLIRETHAALGDETEHAQICFGLASGYAQQPVGPGALSLTFAFDGPTDLRTVLSLVVREGCIGETIAAIEAEEAAKHVESDTLRLSLERIARDERRHAELAWRFVVWALEQSGGGLDQVLLEEISRAEREARLTLVTSESPSRLAYGIVGDTLRAEIRRRALSEIIAPCGRALCARNVNVKPGGARANAESVQQTVG